MCDLVISYGCSTLVNYKLHLPRENFFYVAHEFIKQYIN